MRRLSFKMLPVAAALSAAGLAPAAMADLTDGLVAHYTFNDCTAKDISGNGYNGLIHWRTTSNCVAGMRGTGVFLNYVDGVNEYGAKGGEYVSLPTFPALWINGFTGCAWASFQNDDRGWERLFDLGNGSIADNILLSRIITSTTLQFASFIGSSYSYIDATSAIVNNVFKLYCGTVDSVNQKLRIYIDGVKVIEGNSIYNNITRVSNFLGRSNWHTSIDDDFRGIIDDVRFYSRSLTAVDIQQLYQEVTTQQLTITKTGTGTGTVTSNPIGINCGTTCSANFANNTLVTLATTPSNGSVFSGWSEDSDPDCTDNQVTLNINKICTAIFNIIAPPNVVTNSPSIVTTNTARLQGTVNPNYAQTTVTFACNNRSPISGNPNFITADAGATEVYANLSGLTCNTQYTCRCVATNSAGTTNGNYQTFTTSGTTCTPLAVTNQANAITPTSATLNATVTPNGANTGVIFEFGPTTNYGTNIVASVNTISATSAAKAIRGNVHGLICNTTYNYRIKAVNSFGTTYGTNASFKTLSCPDLIVTKIISNPTMPTANGIFSAVVTIKNQGGILTDGAFVDVWSNKTTAQICGDFGDNWAVIDTLSAGASTTVTITDLPAGTPGTKMLRAFVDSDCSVTESNDTNNQGTAFYSVNQPTAKVDFAVTGITLNPVVPAVNGIFTAAVTVKNQGTVAGAGKLLDVWSNQAANQVCGAAGNKRLAVGTLNAGASKTLTFTGIAAGATGSKIFRAFIDSGCGTGEKLESNNQLVKAYNTVNR